MEEVSTTNPEKEPEKIPSTEIPIQDDVQQVEESNKNENNTTENNNSKCNSIEPLLVKINKEKGWSKQEIISVIAIIISASLLVITLVILRNTLHAINISESTLADSRKKDIVNSMRNKIADSLSNVQYERNRIKDSLSMELARKSLQTQIHSVGESQKQFKVLNRPILQIGDIAIANLKAGEKPVLICQIENVGNFTAKVLTRKIKIGYVHNITERIKIGKWVSIEIPTYVTKETPFTETFSTNDILGKEYYEAVINGVLKILVIGEIEYVNEVTKDNWIFKFVIEIKPPPSKEFIIRVADNRLK